MPASPTCSKRQDFTEPAGKTEIARSGFFMGCPWEIRVHGPFSMEGVVDASFGEISRVEELLSRFKPASEVSRINRWNGKRPLKIDPEVFYLLREALAYAVFSKGAFDSFSGNYEGFRFHSRDPVLLSKPEGARIDLGAIGKGYGVDRAAGILKSAGIPSGRVSAGSTAYAWGDSPGGKGWCFGIRNPFRPEKVSRRIILHDEAISTSGAYEQGAHIRDFRWGEPVKRRGSVTVVAPGAAAADALSTAAFVLGPEAAGDFLGSFECVENFFIDEDRGEESQGISRRAFLSGAAAAAGLVFLAPLVSFAKVYLSPEKALRKVLPGAETFEEMTVSLTPDQKEKILALLGKKVNGEDYTIYKGFRSDSGEVAGYGVVLDVIGKERPITFMVGVGPDNRISGIEILAYRESRGYEIRSKRFRKQFRGISLEDPLKMGQDFYGISGATLSCRSTAFAVRKAMALTKVLYGAGGE